MKHFLIVVVGMSLLLGVMLLDLEYSQAQTVAQPTLPKQNTVYNTSAVRACKFPIGGWTIVNCSNVAAATSAQLSAWGRYIVQCTDDSYIAWGDEATDVADANDGYLPEGAWLEFVTDGTARYVSCLNVNSDADCRYIACL